MHKKVILDVRSSIISKHKIVRLLKNYILRLESHFFYRHFVISKEINDFLKLNLNCEIIPLGSNPNGFSLKKFDTLRILYIGTFHLRNLHIFIDALGYAYTQKKIDFEYFSIIGFGSPKDIDLISNAIKKWKLDNKIKMLGKLTSPITYDFLKSHNLGISYVPVTDFFYFQPPTKTIEYLMSGMPVIATNNILSNSLINHLNGVIIGDSFDECVIGISKFYQNFPNYNSNQIIENTKVYSWEQIIERFLFPSIEKIINE